VIPRNPVKPHQIKNCCIALILEVLTQGCATTHEELTGFDSRFGTPEKFGGHIAHSIWKFPNIAWMG
jgi:hypothetical protein